MIKWVRAEAGEYTSTDGRFQVRKTWNRLYGNHWALYDKEYKKDQRPRGPAYNAKTLKACQHMAELYAKECRDAVTTKETENIMVE